MGDGGVPWAVILLVPGLYTGNRLKETLSVETIT